MAGIIKIRDHENEFLAFDLRDLVALIPLEASHLIWSVFDLQEATFINYSGQPGESGFDRIITGLGLTEAELYRRVDEKPTGWVLNWPEFLSLAGLIHQTIDGMFVGCEDAGALPSLDYDDLDNVGKSFYSAVEIAFQAVDSSYWLVYSKSNAVLGRIANRFEDVTRIKFW